MNNPSSTNTTAGSANASGSQSEKFDLSNEASHRLIFSGKLTNDAIKGYKECGIPYHSKLGLVAIGTLIRAGIQKELLSTRWGSTFTLTGQIKKRLRFQGAYKIYDPVDREWRNVYFERFDAFLIARPGNPYLVAMDSYIAMKMIKKQHSVTIRDCKPVIFVENKPGNLKKRFTAPAGIADRDEFHHRFAKPSEIHREPEQASNGNNGQA